MTRSAKVTLELEEHKNAYQVGDIVRGRVHVTVKRERPCFTVRVDVLLRVHGQRFEIHENVDRPVGSIVVYQGALSKGQHSLEFKFVLDETMPMVFEGQLFRSNLVLEARLALEAPHTLPWQQKRAQREVRLFYPSNDRVFEVGALPPVKETSRRSAGDSMKVAIWIIATLLCLFALGFIAIEALIWLISGEEIFGWWGILFYLVAGIAVGGVYLERLWARHVANQIKNRPKPKRVPPPDVTFSHQGKRLDMEMVFQSEVPEGSRVYALISARETASTYESRLVRLLVGGGHTHHYRRAVNRKRGLFHQQVELHKKGAGWHGGVDMPLGAPVSLVHEKCGVSWGLEVCVVGPCHDRWSLPVRVGLRRKERVLF